MQASTAFKFSKIKGPTDKAFTKSICQRFSSGLTLVFVSTEFDPGTFCSVFRLLLASEAALVDLYPFNGGYSVMGVDADSAVGLLGLLLFINLLRVISSFFKARKRYASCRCSRSRYPVHFLKNIELSDESSERVIF